MSELHGVEILDGGKAVRLEWSDGMTARFHAVWLRDHALDPGTKAPGNGQRLITVLDIPGDTHIVAANITPDGGLALTFAPEDKPATFPADWLRTHRYDVAMPGGRGWTPHDIARWDSELAESIPTETYDAVRSDENALHRWLGAVRRYGFAKMTGMPAESGAICDVVELFGFVRETNYGRWFEVRSEIDPVNLAYTGLGLQVHTDNPYRDPVPTLQLLACLENSADGGDSVVVDGFKAAEILQQETPAHFDLLTAHAARFTYAGSADVHLSAKRPMIELGPDGELRAVRFNNRSAGPLTDIPFEAMADYYDAYRHFAEILERPDLKVSFKLRPGELFIVDNTRVMHGRNAYAGTGTRWLQGCYADKDGLLSKLAAGERRTKELQA
ncbi:2-trimethylaminoethylphosphonate dioxygenase [Ferruginivarius sediminum]|uniref:2-trimethylaminoethylphosphonate dioxygenase n=1 Tax=Ferruginivarius sediminum TaxID=2661937 RepID=UPI0019D42F4B|nr:gamma-butyrobetaine dioxygenase [Ferruginivarius sediminum]